MSSIETQTSLLRRLKACYGRKRRQEKAKALNRQFKEDPGRVYATINKTVADDPDNDCSKYIAPAKSDLENGVSGMFISAVEAAGLLESTMAGARDWKRKSGVAKRDRKGNPEVRPTLIARQVETVDKWHEHEPKTVEEKNDITILYDMPIQTDRDFCKPP